MTTGEEVGAGVGNEAGQQIRVDADQVDGKRRLPGGHEVVAVPLAAQRNEGAVHRHRRDVPRVEPGDHLSRGLAGPELGAQIPCDVHAPQGRDLGLGDQRWQRRLGGPALNRSTHPDRTSVSAPGDDRHVEPAWPVHVDIDRELKPGPAQALPEMSREVWTIGAERDRVAQTADVREDAADTVAGMGPPGDLERPVDAAGPVEDRGVAPHHEVSGRHRPRQSSQGLGRRRKGLGLVGGLGEASVAGCDGAVPRPENWYVIRPNAG